MHQAQHHFCMRWRICTHHRMRGETQTLGLNMGCSDGFDMAALGEVEVGDGRRERSLTPAAAAEVAGRQGPLQAG